MKQTIRINSFETNSSSTHSCIICTAEELDALNNGLMYISKYSDDIETKENLEKEWAIEWEKNATDLEFDTWLEENDWIKFDQWGEDYEGGSNCREINGQKIYAICYYGYDY